MMINQKVEDVNMAKMLKVDFEKCTGCRACEMVCSLVHTGECNPLKSNIRNININNEYFLSIMCFQCDDPPCAKTCPVNAIQKNFETGLVTVDEEKCVGCKLCVLACPFGNMGFSREMHHPFKCDLCGGDPQCIAYCSTKAITFVNIDDEILKKNTDLAERLIETYTSS